MRSLEKALKMHDNRVNRNLHQANNNIISLFEKYNMGSQDMRGEMKKVDSHVEALVSYLENGNNKNTLSQVDFKVTEILYLLSKSSL